MMSAYTIEDIETIRKKSGISYQEAVALLDYHNGNLAMALVDLEKNGRLKGEDHMSETASGTKTINNQKDSFRVKTLNLFQRLYRSRVRIQKGETPVINLSVLFCGFCALFAPYICIAGVIVSMILGYKFSFSKMDSDFRSDNLEKMVKNAAQNAKASVTSVVRTFTGESGKNGTAEKKSPVLKADTAKKEESVKKEEIMKTQMSDDGVNPAEELKKQAQEIEKTLDSFFESNPAATTFHSAYSASASSVPTIQVPVQVESKEGSVRMEDNEDGYHSVTIE